MSKNMASYEQMVDCPKTKITLFSQKGHRQSNETMKARSKYMKPAQSGVCF